MERTDERTNERTIVRTAELEIQRANEEGLNAFGAADA